LEEYFESGRELDIAFSFSNNLISAVSNMGEEGGDDEEDDSVRKSDIGTVGFTISNKGQITSWISMGFDILQKTPDGLWEPVRQIVCSTKSVQKVVSQKANKDRLTLEPFKVFAATETRVFKGDQRQTLEEAIVNSLITNGLMQIRGIFLKKKKYDFSPHDVVQHSYLKCVGLNIKEPLVSLNKGYMELDFKVDKTVDTADRKACD